MPDTLADQLKTPEAVFMQHLQRQTKEGYGTIKTLTKKYNKNSITITCQG